MPALRRCRRLSASRASAPAAVSSNSLPRRFVTATRAWRTRAVKQFFDWCDDPPAETSGYQGHAHTTARSLARLYGALTRGGEVDGYRIVRPEALERFWAEQSFGADQVLMQCWSAEPAWHDAGVEQQRRMARWDNATQRCVDRYGCRR